MRFAQLQALFAEAGCVRLYAKHLAENDNSKNQIYFGPDYQSLNLFPNKGISSDQHLKNPIFKAKLDFGWLLPNGSVATAPGAQLILYPQYPEVRFSGFLRGCAAAPSELMAGRSQGRILFLGVTSKQQVLGTVVGAYSVTAKEFRMLKFPPTTGIFIELSLPAILDAAASRTALLNKLRNISQKGWIDSKQLAADGTIKPCNAPQCGGFTLEAELGIAKNSYAEPDFLGWEVKQHSVSNFDHLEAGTITLMTPEPTGGYYKDKGPEAFVRRYGYVDKLGRPDRLNFGGIHKAGERHKITNLTMTLVGYDTTKGLIKDVNGAIALISDAEEIAASWDFAGLLKHWTRKHAKAAYVPSQCHKAGPRKYRYGQKVRLAVHTDFQRFINAMACGAVYYDPGIKLENASTDPKVKRRSQFRIASRNIVLLYDTVETVNL